MYDPCMGRGGGVCSEREAVGSHMYEAPVELGHGVSRQCQMY